jgi:hypothetical protein
MRLHSFGLPDTIQISVAKKLKKKRDGVACVMSSVVLEEKQ